MAEHVLISIAAIVAIGVGAQWVAWRFHVPAILLLLICGFVAGPVTHLLDPEDLFGDLFLPVVEASVAIILFEGGLTLRFRELRGTGGMVWRLVTVGAVLTWGGIALVARRLIGLDLDVSLMLGAILVVTGPTVIGPLLSHVRPKGRLGPILRWEGILIDPIGAMLAVLIFEAVILGSPGEAGSAILRGVLRTGVFGTAVGIVAAGIMVLVLKRYLIPDVLHNAVSLALVIGAFTAADTVVEESGLVAVTVMGIALANQRFTPVRHIIEFKETLRVLLISGLFIVLAAEIRLTELFDLGWKAPVFLAAVLAIRFVAVWVSSVGAGLTSREKLLLSAVAPRGIVAAAVSAIFALRLQAEGLSGSGLIAPLTFLVIVGTIVVYGLGAGPLARRLQLSDRDPQGAVIVGAHRFARALAGVLADEDVKVVLVDTDYDNVAAARMAGLPVSFGSILSDDFAHSVEMEGVGRLLALTSNDELNSLAVQHFVHLFGRAEVYQLAPASKGGSARTQPLALHQYGRLLFGTDANYNQLLERFDRGARIKKTRITEEFGLEAFRARYGEAAVPLCILSETGRLTFLVADGRTAPKPGDRLISLIDPDALQREPARSADEELPAPAGSLP